ncbi:MAG: dienelactone hydrolase family protein [Lautropia sp.]
MTSETIELASADGFRLKAYKASPVGRAKGAIVIAPEIFGVNSHIRSVADGYAADGYLVVAPQLFDRAERDFETGYGPDDIAAGRAIIGKLDWANTMRDTAAAVEHARPAGKVAVIGYCWGGTIAWLASSRTNGVACTVAYYGGGIPDFIGEAPKTPMMLHIGEQDQRPSPETGREVSARYPDTKVFIYPAGHGFNCDQRGSYDAGSAQLARQRTLEFLKQHL